MKNIRTSMEVLSEKELLMIHDAVLTILSETGMRVPNAELQQMCRERGCIIENDDTIKFPRTVLEPFIEGMRKASPHKIGDNAQKLQGYVSTQVLLTDYETRTRRYGLRDDNLKGIKLMESLKNIPYTGAVVVPSDVPYNISDVVSVADIVKYSSKPGGTYTLTPIGARYIHMIYELIGARGNYLFESISPLSFKADTVEMALSFAKRGGSLNVAPMAMSAATAPVTVAGTLVLESAEVLGSSYLVHVMTGAYPFFAASCHSIDPTTMLCSFGSPNQALFAVATSQIARFYGVQGGCNTALTDALTPDFQGGFEKGVTAALSSFSGSFVTGCQGIVGADQGFSFEQLVIDNEWLSYMNYITSGFEVSEETIALDMIREIGIAGNFLAEEHTVEHFRNSYWMSGIFSRQDWNNWMSTGSMTITDRAHAFVESATKGYKDMEPVLDNDKCKELDKIVAAAFKDME